MTLEPGVEPHGPHLLGRMRCMPHRTRLAVIVSAEPMFRRAAFVLLAGCLALGGASSAWAWSQHPWATVVALSAMPEVAGQTVRAESLESFLGQQAPVLERALAEHEAWARAQLPAYAPRPEALAFRAVDDAVPLRRRFLQALRVNPTMPLKLFVQTAPGRTRAGRLMDWTEISILRSGSGARGQPIIELAEGEAVSALEVVASASNEPDHGLDIGHFADNGTAHGQVYGFGRQAFGSPSVDFSSQAPFHMGFFHEAWIVRQAAPFLQRSQVEARVALFSALARTAFASGHPYWGWRFTGWALHYVQDMTQPYHARALPGVAVARLLWMNALDLAGRPGAKDDAVTLVTNRHVVVENYQKRRLAEALAAGRNDDLLLRALAGEAAEVGEGRLPLDNLRAVVSAEAAARADVLDAQIERSFPRVLVSDPDRPLGNEADALDMLTTARLHSAAQAEALDRELAALLAALGRHSRALVREILILPRPK